MFTKSISLFIIAQCNITSSVYYSEEEDDDGNLHTDTYPSQVHSDFLLCLT